MGRPNKTEAALRDGQRMTDAEFAAIYRIKELRDYVQRLSGSMTSDHDPVDRYCVYTDHDEVVANNRSDIWLRLATLPGGLTLSEYKKEAKRAAEALRKGRQRHRRTVRETGIGDVYDTPWFIESYDPKNRVHNGLGKNPQTPARFNPDET